MVFLAHTLEVTAMTHQAVMMVMAQVCNFFVIVFQLFRKYFVTALDAII
jgi:hypothetical protein